MNHKALILLAFVGFTAGCSHRVFSPPTRFTALQGPEAVGADKTAVVGEIGTQGDIFGPRLLGFTGRLRHGLTEEVELVGDGVVVQVDDTDAADPDQSPLIVSARLGTKWSVAALNHHVALTGGLGGGGHTGGGFAAADLGFVVGYQNRYAVPFYSIEGGVSLPISASEVDTSRDEDEIGTHVDTPVTSFSIRSNLGVRIPFVLGWGSPGALALGVQHIWLKDVEGEDGTWAGPAAHFETGF